MQTAWKDRWWQPHDVEQTPYPPIGILKRFFAFRQRRVAVARQRQLKFSATNSRSNKNAIEWVIVSLLAGRLAGWHLIKKQQQQKRKKQEKS